MHVGKAPHSYPFSFDPIPPHKQKHEQQKKNDALRRAGHKLAEYIAACVKELTPEDTEVYELEAAIRRDPEVEKLPSVVYVMQPQSQMEEMGYNDLLYGWDTNHMVPTFMHPNEVLDGALVSGSFMPVSSKWSTYDMQNCPNIKALYKEHGKTINFLGVIMSNLNVALDQKERAAQFVAQIATSLGADGAVVAEEGYGNPDADFVGCIVALEDAGVKTVGITNECTGRDGQSQPLVTLDEKCDAIVSCGNVSELIELPPMETVLPRDWESMTPDNREDLRWCVRLRDDSGFVFMVNYQDHDDMRHDQDGLQLELKLRNETLRIPSEGSFTLGKDVSAILPFNLDLSGVLLKYATAQLLAKVDDGGTDHYFFFAPEKMAAEYCFDDGIVKVGEPGFGSTFTHGSVRITTLTREQAENAAKFDGRMLFTEATATEPAPGCLELLSLGDNSVEYVLYPSESGFAPQTASVITAVSCWRRMSL